MSDPGARAGRPRPRVDVDVPRLAALEVLKAVRVDDAYANLVLPAVIQHYQLDTRDAAFTTELASGTLRRRGTYDAILAACIDRPLRKVEDKVLDALRLGAHQLLAMRVPAHAAISTTVNLVHARSSSGAAGFSNAVLRQVAEHDLDAWIVKLAPDPIASPSKYAEIAFSHPRWVVEELRRAVGAAGAVRPAGGRQRAAPGDAGGPPGPVDPRRAARRADAVLPARGRAHGGSPASVPAVAEGRAGVQDEGSQLIAQLLADAPIEGADRTCGWTSAPVPGGKAALLAALAAERGAGLLAVERQQHRSRLVTRALAGADGCPGRGHRGRYDASARARDRSTGCSWTRPARVWVRCAGARRRGGAASPTTCSRWCCCNAG